MRTLDELTALSNRRQGEKDDFGQHVPDVFPNLRGDPRYEVIVERIKKFKGTPTDPAMAGLLRTLKGNPNDLPALTEFARSFERDKQWLAASVPYRKIAGLDPKNSKCHFDLGHALYEAEKRAEAIESLRQCVSLDPANAAGHYYLGLALQAEGKLKEAQERLRHAHEIGSRQSGWTYPSAEKVKQIDRLVELEQQLPAVLRGERKLDAPEEMFQVCRLTRRNAAGAQVFSNAVRLRPVLANDLQAQHRYEAACRAALAASGNGEDAGTLDAASRTRLREQALQWLQADLGAYDKLARSDNSEDRSLVIARMRHWKRDADLASVRTADSLQTLPEAEANEWRNLWGDVEKVARSAGKPTGAAASDPKDTETPGAVACVRRAKLGPGAASGP